MLSSLKTCALACTPFACALSSITNCVLTASSSAGKFASWAQGFFQKHGVDYFKVCAPTGSLAAYRAMLVLAVEYD
jgi:hypothetical protein